MSRYAYSWLLIAILAPCVAAAYPIDTQVHSKGLDVEAIPTLLQEATVVRLVNNETFAVRCNVSFANGPEISKVRKVTVDPASDHLVRFLPSRTVIRLRIDVSCWPAEEEESN